MRAPRALPHLPRGEPLFARGPLHAGDGAEAFASSGPSRSALTLRWDDPNQDVVAIEVTARGRREPLVIPVADPTRGGPWSQT